MCIADLGAKPAAAAAKSASCGRTEAAVAGTSPPRSCHKLKYGDDADRRLFDYVVSCSFRDASHLQGLYEKTKGVEKSLMCSPPDSIPVLQMFLRLAKAKRAIEVGVYTGFVTMGLALALPDDGKVIACDITDKYPSVGKPFWKAAGVDGKIDLRIGPASDTLLNLVKDGQEGTFDFGFIDADKTGYDDYYEKVLRLLRPGGVIVIDNVLWGGRVIDAARQDEDTQAIRALNENIYKDERVHIAMLSVSDGLTVALKK